MRDVMVGDLAVRDHGGDGRPVVLLHGASRNLLDWELVVPHLPHYRLVAMDLRGHGRSGDGWSFAAAVEDVEAVVDALSLGTPAIVGHSLGGMVAAMWSASHPCLAAVNLDGHGLGTPDLYDGMTPDEAAGWIAQLNAMQRNGLTARPPLSPEQVEGLVEAGRQLAALWGVPPELAEDSVRRGITADGLVRPSVATTTALLDELDGLDLVTLWTKTQAPLLVVNANAPDPSLPVEAVEVMASYRRGLSIGLREAAESHPLLTVTDLDADHGLILNQPANVAALIDGFLSGAAPHMPVTAPVYVKQLHPAE